ncbi:uncharacterized protein At5g39865-like [Impatiens glandulifera]|uniref:uncharacterized protein At5g39865-like n=1 Tax=Impatiens glandulifera TaxID=253017 RepID=UPI001FB06942|nr:uncharacterized protein At5g39865-like [Impatiens glandulifera]
MKVKSIPSITSFHKHGMISQVNTPQKKQDHVETNNPPKQASLNHHDHHPHHVKDEDQAKGSCKENLELDSKPNNFAFKPNSSTITLPPGSSEGAILYTTSLRGIRKTFEDCGIIRFLLESFKVTYQERDVSMDMKLREELWNISGGQRMVPPRLFVRGKDIGGADEVVGLHEQGRLWKVLEGLPLKQSNKVCNGCGGVGFLICLRCNGSRKVVHDDDDVFVRCPDCNENGLLRCSICC